MPYINSRKTKSKYSKEKNKHPACVNHGGFRGQVYVAPGQDGRYSKHTGPNVNKARTNSTEKGMAQTGKAQQEYRQKNLEMSQVQKLI